MKAILPYTASVGHGIDRDRWSAQRCQGQTVRYIREKEPKEDKTTRSDQ